MSYEYDDSPYDEEQSDSNRLSGDDVFIKRNEDDELLPVEQEVELLGGTAMVKPMPYGQIEEVFGNLDETDRLEPEIVASILRDHVVDPDLSEMDADEMKRTMKAMAPQALLMAVLEASGVSGSLSQNEDGEAELDVDLGNRN